MVHQLKRAPMGWNSYDYYDTGATEARVLVNAAYKAAHMKDAGWEYMVVDIRRYAKGAGSRWENYQYLPFADVEMDAYGRLLPDPERFPSSAGGKGFRPLAERIHALGLKFGIHIMRGIPRAAAHRHLPILGSVVTANDVAGPSSVCGWNPDMYGVRDTQAGQAYYDSLAQRYADMRSRCSATLCDRIPSNDRGKGPLPADRSVRACWRCACACTPLLRQTEILYSPYSRSRL